MKNKLIYSLIGILLLGISGCVVEDNSSNDISEDTNISDAYISSSSSTAAINTSNPTIIDSSSSSNIDSNSTITDSSSSSNIAISNSTNIITNSTTIIESSSIVGPYDHFGNPNWVQTIPGNIVGKYATIYDVPVEKTVNGINYTYAWSDEFEGNTLNKDYWNIDVNGDGGGNSEKQYYLENNVTVNDGYLSIEGRAEQYQSKKYTSGKINSIDKVQFKYGYIEAMISIPSFQGAWPLFWMMGEQYSWPRCGEIDILETVNDELSIYNVLHYGVSSTDHQQIIIGKYSFSSLAEKNEFHHYEMIWEESCISSYIDGKEIGTINLDSSNRDYFNQNFKFILNLAIGGSWPEANGKGIDDTAFATRQEMLVDYIRVYQQFNNN